MAMASTLLAYALIAAYSTSQATCDPRVDNANTPRCLVFAFIDAMAEAHRLTAVAAPDPKGDSPTDVGAAVLYSIKLRRRGLDAAARSIADYRQHPDSAVRLAAETTIESLELLAFQDDAMERAVKAALDGTDTSSASQHADFQAELRATRRLAAEGLIAAAGAIVIAIARKDPVTGRLSCRRLRRIEVTEALNEISRRFGAAGLESRSDGTFTSDFAVAVRVLRTSLRDPAWKPCA